MRSCGPPPTCLLYGERGLRGESNCSDAAIIAVDGSDDGERGFRGESNDMIGRDAPKDSRISAVRGRANELRAGVKL